MQSELEWFTEDEACSENALFRVIPEIKNDEKKNQTPVYGSSAHPSLFGSEGGAR